MCGRWWCLSLLLVLFVVPLRTFPAGNGARAHGARAKAGTQSFFLSFHHLLHIARLPLYVGLAGGLWQCRCGVRVVSWVSGLTSPIMAAIILGRLRGDLAAGCEHVMSLSAGCCHVPE
jgi:hypothetical protein